MIPEITAVMPCFEAGELLLRGIDSLRRQTLPPAEILVVDDASPGKDTRVALGTASQIPTVRVIELPRNRGVANARNTGLDQARGTHAVFLDADDMLTSGSLAAFVAALEAAPHSDFAYPAVQCFGNRDDTFPPPPFNAYLLHYVNICPIAALVTRRAIDSGVRFDPAIDVGHEDWDYWLRLVAADHMGVAAPDATLLYRRIGFTRMDLGNQIEGGFESVLRRLRPEVFDPARLARLKREWAPGLTMLNDEGESVLEGQTCMDAEVLPVAEAADSRGRYVLVGASDIARTDPTLVEDILSLADGVQAPRWVVTLHPDAVRPGFSSGPLNATDLRAGWARDEDVTSVAVRRSALDVPAGLPPDTAQIMSDIRDASIRAPQEILWRAPWGGLQAAASSNASASEPQPVHRDIPDGWAAEVLDTTPSATPWRIAGTGQGLFGSPPPSTTVPLLWVDDDNGGRALYTYDEGLPAGSCIVGAGPVLVRLSSYGCEPVLRCIDHRTGRRLIAQDPLPPGVTAEAVVGYAPRDMMPGTQPLLAHHGMGSQLLGGRLDQRAPEEAIGDHLQRPLLGAQRLWRLLDPATQRHFYGLAPTTFRHLALPPDGPLGVLLQHAAKGDAFHPVHMALDTDGHFAGLVGGAPPPGNLMCGPVAGWLYSEDGLGREPMTTAWNPDRQSLLVRTIADEGGDEAFRPHEHLGWAPS